MYASLSEMVRAAARDFGDKQFLVAPDRTLTFNEIDRLSDRATVALAALGIQPGDRVSLWLENGWRWIVAYYGTLKLGAIVNPLNILLTFDEVAYIVGDCSAKLVIAGAEKAGALTKVIAAPVISDQPMSPDMASLDELLAGASGDPPRVMIEAQDIAAICYTSGTTGFPKGAALRHAGIVTNTMMTALMHGRSADDTVVSALPCSHVYGNIVMNAAVACGSRLVLLPRFDESVVLTSIERHRATIFDGVPTMYVRLLSHSALSITDRSTLRICTVGGQSMPAESMEQVERAFGCRLIELWGMTELGGLGATHPVSGARKLGAMGIALPFAQTKVVDRTDRTCELPLGEVGELLIRGPIVMAGYHDNPTATHDAIDADGWLQTGDLVRQDADGYLYLVDRKKDVIISGGYNVYPAEVERVLASHPTVLMVAVAAVHDATKGHVPKAFVVTKPGETGDADALIAHCKSVLAAYKIPRAIEFVGDLPKNSTGKVLRRALVEQPS